MRRADAAGHRHVVLCMFLSNLQLQHTSYVRFLACRRTFVHAAETAAHRRTGRHRVQNFVILSAFWVLNLDTRLEPRYVL